MEIFRYYNEIANIRRVVIDPYFANWPSQQVLDIVLERMSVLFYSVVGMDSGETLFAIQLIIGSSNMDETTGT